MLEVVGQVDRRHSALTKLTLDGVAAFEGCVQTSDGIGHGGQHASKTCGAASVSAPEGTWTSTDQPANPPGGATFKGVTYVTLRAFGGKLFGTDRAKFFVDFFLSGDGAYSDWERAQESPGPPPNIKRHCVPLTRSFLMVLGSRWLLAHIRQVPRALALLGCGGPEVLTRSRVPRSTRRSERRYEPWQCPGTRPHRRRQRRIRRRRPGRLRTAPRRSQSRHD